MKRLLFSCVAVFLVMSIPAPILAFTLETGETIYPNAGTPGSEATVMAADSILALSLYDNYALYPRAARRRAAVRRTIRRHRESGFSIQYVDSQLKDQTDTFTGNLWLIGLQRRFRFPLSNFYMGGKLAGGMYVTGQGVEGGLGYGGFTSGFEFGHRPFRLALGCLFGAGGVGIHETRIVNNQEETYHLSRGFLILEPEVSLLLTTSPFSSLALGASYQYIPVGEARNLGGPSLSLSFLFSRL